jgi:hypothetical protein
MIGDRMPELLPVSFGSLLRSLRTAAGLTQEELAEAARVSYRSVSDKSSTRARETRKRHVLRPFAGHVGCGVRRRGLAA